MPKARRRCGRRRCCWCRRNTSTSIVEVFDRRLGGQGQDSRKGRGRGRGRSRGRTGSMGRRGRRRRQELR